jgi:Tfp pilus assembly protein PilO
MTTRSEKTSRYFTYIQPVLKIPLVKTYGYIIFTIMALSIFIVFAIKPTIQTIAVLQKELVVQQDALNKVNEKSKNLAEARQNYQQIPADTKTKINTAIPKDAQIAQVIKSLEQAALVSQASISALQFQPISLEKSNNQKEQQLEEIPFTFNLEGSFDSLKLVLDNLRNSSRLLNIEGVIFNKTETGKSLLMSVSGKAYYIK